MRGKTNKLTAVICTAGMTLLPIISHSQSLHLEGPIDAVIRAGTYNGMPGQPGITGNNLQDSTIQISDISARGGSANTSNADHSAIYANGGIGVSLSQSVAPTNGSSEIDWPEIYTPVNPGDGEIIVITPFPPYPYGGNGSELTVTPLIIGSITNPPLPILQGGSAGTVLISGGNAWATGGEGISISNILTIANGGTFTGGNGGTLNISTGGQILSTGGQWIGSSNPTLTPGTFIPAQSLRIPAAEAAATVQHSTLAPLTPEYPFNFSNSQFFGGHAGAAVNTSKYAMAEGGMGMYLNATASVQLTNCTMEGGNGGYSHGMNFTKADGGDGLQLYSSTNTFIINSSFFGGHGGTAVVANASDTWSYNERASADGGHGLLVDANPDLTQSSGSLLISNVTATGGNGGHTDSQWNRSASGGHGMIIQNYSNVVINGGSYSGGNSGTQSMTPNLVPGDSIRSSSSRSQLFRTGSGGKGMVLKADTAEILDGTFTGGESYWSHATGLEFSGKKLIIHDGNFSAGDMYDYGTGLNAEADESVQIYGGRFSSIRIHGTTEMDTYTDFYLSRDAFNYGSLNLSGNIRVDKIDQGTLQSLFHSYGELQLNAPLTLEPHGYLNAGGALIATNITMRSSSVISLNGDAKINRLTLEKEASLALSDKYDSGYPDIHINQAIVEEGAIFSYYNRYSTSAPGQTSTAARISAKTFQIVNESGSHELSDNDLAPMLKLEKSYLTEYTSIYSRNAEGHLIEIRGTGLSLADKADNPLPKALSRYIDNYRTRRNENLNPSPYRMDLEIMLYYLQSDWMRPSMLNEYDRYFNTAATPMSVQVVQAGQQARQNQILNHMSAFRSSGGMASAPTGPSGPVSTPAGWNGWMKGYGTDANKDSDGSYVGYDANIAGAVIGLERTGDNTLFGFAGGSGRTDIDTDEPGSSNVDTYFGAIYGSMSGKNLFFDTSISYGHNRIDNQRGFSSAYESEYDAHNLSGYIGGGHPIHIGEKLSLTPEIGGQLNYYLQEAFTETGPMDKTYEEYDYWYFQSIIGLYTELELSAGDSILFKPELSLHWNHNFNPDPDRISYTIADTGTGGTAGIQSPEEDTLILGAGIVTRLKERIDIDLRINQQLADGWESTTYSGSLKVHF